MVSGKLFLNPAFYSHHIVKCKLDGSSKEDNREWKNIFLQMMKHSLIHKKSSHFSIGLTVVPINPNVPSLYSVSFSHIDNYIYNRASLYDGINELSLAEKNRVAYRDLRLYQLMPLSSGELLRINTKDITFIDKNTALLYVEHNLLVRTSIPTYTLIKVTGEELVDVLKENLNNGVEFPFNGNEIKKDFSVYQKEQYGSLHVSAIKMTTRNLSVLSSSPAQAVIAYDRTAVSRLTISELNVLHPNKVPEHLLVQEVERVLYAQKRPDCDKESDENEASAFSIKDLDKLQDLLKMKTTSEFRKKIGAVKNELLKYESDPDSIAQGNLITSYIIWLLERVEKKKKMAISTFKGYIGLLEKHLFSNVEDLSQLQPSELDKIIDGLYRQQYKGKSIRKIRALIAMFFKHHKQNPNMAHIDTSSIPKSLIFREELTQVLEYIADSVGQGTLRQGKNARFYMLETQALVILAFYTGLRKSELRSRLLEDISIYGNKIYIDVNSDGLKRLDLKLKTSNAKRRVGAIIEDAEHLKILNDFFAKRSKIGNKSKFLFLQVKQIEVLVDDVKHIKYAVKSKALPETEFDDITTILQSLTGRYVTFHSFRHSYASYEVKRIIENPSADPHQLIDLALRMGHESPETTLKVYVHRSLLEMGGATC
ncbi:tyrosine-type recombinase/integrase [Sulfurimonas sp.]|nr:tyrosine-type recombinase/integrase [Sulfurimonas sp.]